MGKPRPQPRCANAGEFDRGVITPNQLRWRPFAIPSDSVDFVRGLTTVCGAGSAGKKDGFAIHVYTASVSMDNSCLANADGDMLIVPQQGEAQSGCCPLRCPINTIMPQIWLHQRRSSFSSPKTLNHTEHDVHHIHRHVCVHAASAYSNLDDTNTPHVANAGVTYHALLTPRARKQSRIWWLLTS